MPAIDRHDTTTLTECESVLVLTDRSDWADRVAKWGLVFTVSSNATVHRIDVVACLDSGVIVHRDERDQDKACEFRATERHSTATADSESNRETIDVLHGVPHKAINEYAAQLAVDRLIICACERSRSQRTFIGDTFTNVARTATIPTTIVEQSTDSRELLRAHDHHEQTHPQDASVDRTHTVMAACRSVTTKHT